MTARQLQKAASTEKLEPVQKVTFEALIDLDTTSEENVDNDADVTGKTTSFSAFFENGAVSTEERGCGQR